MYKTRREALTAAKAVAQKLPKPEKWRVFVFRNRFKGPPSWEWLLQCKNVSIDVDAQGLCVAEVWIGEEQIIKKAKTPARAYRNAMRRAASHLKKEISKYISAGGDVGDLL